MVYEICMPLFLDFLTFFSNLKVLLFLKILKTNAVYTSGNIYPKITTSVYCLPSAVFYLCALFCLF